MWNPTLSSSTAPSSDNPNIKEVVGVDDCKCSGGIDQSDQQQKNCSKEETTLFDGQSTVSNNIQQQHRKYSLGQEAKGNKAFADVTGETTDSGFISGPQSSYSNNLNKENEESGDIKKLNERKSSREQQQHYKEQEQSNLDSGLITELDERESDLEGHEKNHSKDSKMILPQSVDSGISEWFCKLTLHNNPIGNTISSAPNSMSAAGSGLNNLNTPKQQSSVHQTRTPVLSSSYAAVSTDQQYQKQSAAETQQITPANAWEKYYQQNDDGDTTLHLACISGYEEVVAVLIRMTPHPCLLNIQNDEAQTPLHLATLTAHPKIVRMLLIAGAKPTIRDRHGNTALHLACISGEEQCVRALTIPISASEVNETNRQYGHRANDKSYTKYAQLPSDLEIRNYDGERCVHLATQAGFINILRILVLYGADINAREGKSGRTPLHIAIESCNEELSNYILDECQTLNLETETYAGLTAYQVACILNKSEMQNILEKRGAEPLTPPDSDDDNDDDSSDIEMDLDDTKLYGYDRFVGCKGINALAVS